MAHDKLIYKKVVDDIDPTAALIAYLRVYQGEITWQQLSENQQATTHSTLVDLYQRAKPQDTECNTITDNESENQEEQAKQYFTVILENYPICTQHPQLRQLASQSEYFTQLVIQQHTQSIAEHKDTALLLTHPSSLGYYILQMIRRYKNSNMITAALVCEDNDTLSILRFSLKQTIFVKNFLINLPVELKFELIAQLLTHECDDRDELAQKIMEDIIEPNLDSKLIYFMLLTQLTEHAWNNLADKQKEKLANYLKEKAKEAGLKSCLDSADGVACTHTKEPLPQYITVHGGEENKTAFHQLLSTLDFLRRNQYLFQFSIVLPQTAVFMLYTHYSHLSLMEKSILAESSNDALACAIHVSLFDTTAHPFPMDNPPDILTLLTTYLGEAKDEFKPNDPDFDSIQIILFGFLYQKYVSGNQEEKEQIEKILTVLFSNNPSLILYILNLDESVFNTLPSSVQSHIGQQLYQALPTDSDEQSHSYTTLSQYARRTYLNPSYLKEKGLMPRVAQSVTWAPLVFSPHDISPEDIELIIKKRPELFLLHLEQTHRKCAPKKTIQSFRLYSYPFTQFIDDLFQNDPRMIATLMRILNQKQMSGLFLTLLLDEFQLSGRPLISEDNLGQLMAHCRPGLANFFNRTSDEQRKALGMHCELALLLWVSNDKNMPKETLLSRIKVLLNCINQRASFSRGPASVLNRLFQSNPVLRAVADSPDEGGCLTQITPTDLAHLWKDQPSTEDRLSVDCFALDNILTSLDDKDFVQFLCVTSRQYHTLSARILLSFNHQKQDLSPEACAPLAESYLSGLNKLATAMMAINLKKHNAVQLLLFVTNCLALLEHTSSDFIIGDSLMAVFVSLFENYTIHIFIHANHDILFRCLCLFKEDDQVKALAAIGVGLVDSNMQFISCAKSFPPSLLELITKNNLHHHLIDNDNCHPLCLALLSMLEKNKESNTFCTQFFANLLEPVFALGASHCVYKKYFNVLDFLTCSTHQVINVQHLESTNISSFSLGYTLFLLWAGSMGERHLSIETVAQCYEHIASIDKTKPVDEWLLALRQGLIENACSARQSFATTIRPYSEKVDDKQVSNPFILLYEYVTNSTWHYNWRLVDKSKVNEFCSFVIALLQAENSFERHQCLFSFPFKVLGETDPRASSRVDCIRSSCPDLARFIGYWQHFCDCVLTPLQSSAVRHEGNEILIHERLKKAGFSITPDEGLALTAEV